MNNKIWEKEIYYQVIKNTHNIDNINNDPVFLHFIKLLKVLTKKSILDVGCGEGWMIENLSKNLEGKNLFTGIDVSEAGLKEANNRKINNATFLKYDGQSFPFSDNTFDVVLSNFVFEHLSDPLDTFNEMIRVVKKEGLIIIACPNFGSPLFKSPCNNINRAILIISRFIKELIPKFYFKNNFHWNRVTPIKLPSNIHISDYDTLCEPSLSSFKKFLDNNKDKYFIVEIDSLWNSYKYEQNLSKIKLNYLKKQLVNFTKFLGIKKILRFQYFGSFFFVAIKKI